MTTDNNPADNTEPSADGQDPQRVSTAEHGAEVEIADKAPEPDVPGELKSPPQILASISLELPADTESPDFVAALVALRPLYATRTEFNFMVCDQLALRGVAPNGLNVRNAGRWGNPAAVGADVKAWYAALSARLSAEHAHIPEAVKRGANALFEQLWSLAREATIGPARLQIQQLAEDLQSALVERDNTAAMLSRREDELQALAQQSAQTESDLRGQLLSAHTEIEDLRGQVHQLQASIAQAALTHQVELRTQAARYEAQLLAQREAHDAQLREHGSELQAAQAALLRERERSDEIARAHALQVDQFRQDIKEGGHRLDKALEASSLAKAQADDLRAQLTQASIANVRIEQQLAQSQQEAVALRERYARLELELTELQKKIKPTEEPYGGDAPVERNS
jgi:hypothetical protein